MLEALLLGERPCDLALVAGQVQICLLHLLTSRLHDVDDGGQGNAHADGNQRRQEDRHQHDDPDGAELLAAEPPVRVEEVLKQEGQTSIEEEAAEEEARQVVDERKAREVEDEADHHDEDTGEAVCHIADDAEVERSPFHLGIRGRGEAGAREEVHVADELGLAVVGGVNLGDPLDARHFQQKIDGRDDPVGEEGGHGRAEGRGVCLVEADLLPLGVEVGAAVLLEKPARLAGVLNVHAEDAQHDVEEDHGHKEEDDEHGDWVADVVALAEVERAADREAGERQLPEIPRVQVMRVLAGGNLKGLFRDLVADDAQEADHDGGRHKLQETRLLCVAEDEADDGQAHRVDEEGRQHGRQQLFGVLCLVGDDLDNLQEEQHGVDVGAADGNHKLGEADGDDAGENRCNEVQTDALWHEEQERLIAGEDDLGEDGGEAVEHDGVDDAGHDRWEDVAWAAVQHLQAHLVQEADDAILEVLRRLWQEAAVAGIDIVLQLQPHMRHGGAHF
eukprot:m.127243 g.127243  ORF g.127243 m.127243 type:complete len:504 (+) comp16359_c0_seq2:2232-3743(+)